MMSKPAPIAVALDAPDLETAARWAGLVTPHVSTVKIGLELYLRYGPGVVASIRAARGVRAFLGLQLHDIPAPARRLAVLAVGAGARALVCSPREVASVRAEVGPDIRLITPGVRPAGADRNDQARVATPEEALREGADLLVIGRPITGAPDPGAAAAAIAGPLRRLAPAD